ncbi:DUF1707 domain-containing protein [Streptomyces sp. UNOC14_S4]|uniref:DUF1707 SHOCT-like domain-containing protein n=1 Tax=Streptomyces sp. UNOC14_S4 TaxID=2872340 RepID=UPI0035AF67C9
MDESSLEKRAPVSFEKAEKAGPESPAVQAGLRASDADRDRVADILREALGEGRITAEEHAERVGRVYEARTVGELEPLVHDLPSVPRHEPAAPARPQDAPVRPVGVPYGSTESLVAVFGGATRNGRWRVAPRINAFALFGGVEIDLTEAVFEHQHVVVNATAIFGGIEIKVPENITLRSTGSGVFGGFEVKTYEAPDADAPVVTVMGFAVFGGVEAKPKRGKRLRDLWAGR